MEPKATMVEPAAHAHVAFVEAEANGEPARPLDFPPPRVARGVRVNALVVHPETGTRQVCSGVIHREELATSGEQFVSYWPQRRLQDAIFGSVWACLVLRKHHGVAADDAARAAGVEPGSPKAPIVWEITGEHVAIKMIEWARVHHMRGRLLEDPVKEVAAMQLLGVGHPHVLGSREVLQDGDFLYSVMPYCSGGDLFGVVVQHAEENGGEIGMPEPVARYWFRQILWVSTGLPWFGGVRVYGYFVRCSHLFYFLTTTGSSPLAIIRRLPSGLVVRKCAGGQG